MARPPIDAHADVRRATGAACLEGAAPASRRGFCGTKPRGPCLRRWTRPRWSERSPGFEQERRSLYIGSARASERVYPSGALAAAEPAAEKLADAWA